MIEGAKRLKRAPFRFSEFATILGRVIEVETDSEKMLWSKRPYLIWDPGSKVAYWSEGSVLEAPEAPVLQNSDAHEAFEIWQNDRPSKIRTIDFPEPKTWEKLRVPTRIDYESDREGKLREYTHAIHEAQFYRFGDKKRWAYAIKGLQISDRGLI